MEKVTVSSRYQVVIPRSVREPLNIHPGQEVQMVPHGGHIELIPVRLARGLRGYLWGPNTFERENDRACT